MTAMNDRTENLYGGKDQSYDTHAGPTSWPW